MTNLDTILKRRHYLANKGPPSQNYDFSSNHVWMWELDNKKSWPPKNWCLWIVVLKRLLRTPWTARRSNQPILKEINPEYSLEGLMLKLKLQYFGHLMGTANSLEKTLKDWRQEEKEMTENEMVGWHHLPNGHESEQPLGDEGHGSLECLSPWGHKKSDMTKWVNDDDCIIYKQVAKRVDFKCSHPPQRNVVNSPYLQVLHFQIQPPENSKK